MPQLYIKICGLSTPESVAAAVEAGADAVGFVFAPGSPRTVDAELAAARRRPFPRTLRPSASSGTNRWPRSWTSRRVRP